MIRRDNPLQGPEGELRHIENCDSCQKMKAEVSLLESELNSFPNEVEKHIFAKPILFKEIAKPAASKIRPQTIIVLGVILLIVALWLVIHSKPEKESFSQPVHNENAIPKSLPGGFIVEAEKNLQSTQTSFFSAQMAKLKRGEEILLSFNDACFKLLPSGVELESGRINVNVARKGTDFSVSTFNAIISVHGTVFTVEVKESISTEVKVSRGLVMVVNIAGDKLTLKAGESALVGNDGKIEKTASDNSQQPGIIQNENRILEGTASAQQMLNE